MHINFNPFQAEWSISSRDGLGRCGAESAQADFKQSGQFQAESVWVVVGPNWLG